MNIAAMIILFFVSSWMIIHLGMKPERGGRPPSDSMTIRMSDVISGNLFHVWDSDSVVVDVLSINNINVPRVVVI